jgi:N utilization substance protein B
MPILKSTDLKRKAREGALQSLFAVDIKGSPDEESLEWLVEEDSLPARSVDFAQVLLRGVSNNRPTLDSVIERYAPAWPVDQLSLVDRNILRIAMYELLFTPQIPRKSAINEAVELAKAFGSESSARFVNGVLGSVMAGLEKGELAPHDTAPEGR